MRRQVAATANAVVSDRVDGDRLAAIARVHTITGTHFGYTGDRPTGADWPTAYAPRWPSFGDDNDPPQRIEDGRSKHGPRTMQPCRAGFTTLRPGRPAALCQITPR